MKNFRVQTSKECGSSIYKVKDVIHHITEAWNVGALSNEVAKEDLDRIYVMPTCVSY